MSKRKYIESNCSKTRDRNKDLMKTDNHGIPKTKSNHSVVSDQLSIQWDITEDLTYRITAGWIKWRNALKCCAMKNHLRN